MGKLSFKGYYSRDDLEECKGEPILFRATIIDEYGDEVPNVFECLKASKKELILRKKEEK